MNIKRNGVCENCQYYLVFINIIIIIPALVLLSTMTLNNSKMEVEMVG